MGEYLHRKMSAGTFDSDLKQFMQQLEALQGRLDRLYHCVNTANDKSHLLSSAFKELGMASEELQVAMEELLLQAEESAALQLELAAERQRYKNLFEFLPYAYLETDTRGKIIEANPAAANLLNVSQRFLVGKHLDIYLIKSDRRQFRARLVQIQQPNIPQEWIAQIQPRQSEPLKAVLTVSSHCDLDNQPSSLHCIVQDFRDRQPGLRGDNDDNNTNLYQNRPRYIYHKGEIISLKPQTIWLIYKGVIKLSTISESGDERIVGLLRESMPFSSSMTSLQLYEATVLSETAELISISQTEIAASVQLSQTLFPLLNQRLQQTEFLLAMAGKRQITDRLHCFLSWLKAELGQPTPEGTRLTVRLTHQDFANACCTTRVTITRLFSQLQQQGKITFDAQRHLVWRD
ncbi:MAG: helix-turn-helix domain-containing protein [Coleofasciculus chthonoplastes F3-SA18-01]|jgi:PAS domain S-box-containing protein|uniref:helix-turn-helix domain-containing protein n=1 Tax=Coleofasciculus chthonoplastes TaxID=64178 RepID=UPI0032F60271